MMAARRTASLRRTAARLAWAIPAAVVLAACSRDMSDLKEDIEEIKSRESGYVEPIPQMERYERYVYEPAGRRAPFQPVIEQSQPLAKSQSSTEPPPDRSRTREPLEQHPLDSMKMVGTLQQNGVRWALVRDGEGTLHRVREGNYIGQNYGEIVAITDTAIKIEEKVPDGFGGWKERSAELPLEE